MRPALVFNELSLSDPTQAAEPSAVFDDFAATLTTMRLNYSDAYLVSSVQLWGHGANLHSVFGSWAVVPENRDKVRQIAAMQNRAPLESEFGVLGNDRCLVEYAFGGSVCFGLGYAYELELLAVSIRSSESLDTSWLELSRESLSDSDEPFLSDLVSVRHASRETHVSVHIDWLDRGDISKLSADEVWLHRARLFGRINFLDRVQDDLRKMDARSLGAVKSRLTELQIALETWDTETTAEPSWLSKITPESESRIQSGVCDFRDTDGLTRTFSKHARYTPGAGRIHFRLVRTTGRIVVAYVGAKLGS